MRRIRLFSMSALSTLALILAGCAGSPGTQPEAPPSGAAADDCISSFDPAVDYYPDKQALQYATNFTLSYHRSYQVLTVKQPVVGGTPQSYVLVQCGAPRPELTGTLTKATVLETPVKRLFSASTTHLPSLEALGQLDILTGVASKALISSAAAKQQAAPAEVTEFAASGTADAEKIIAAKPDVLVTAGYDDPAYATVRDAGVPVLADAEFLEADPLGRAEWIKYFAALTGTEKQAAATFATISADYAAAVAVAAEAKPVEAVLSQPYQGVWSMPAGGSYAGRLVTEAGGTWPWKSNSSTGSIDTDLETVFDRSGKARTWISSANWVTRKDALAEEPRFADFAAFSSTGTVWAPSRQVNAAGGNNYYELGALRPDLTIKDLIAILHPDLMPGHSFAFYQQLK
jgi:iron complex transport system substrate-binding protein